jgi:magnesium-transporting ATPase (P-type)
MAVLYIVGLSLSTLVGLWHFTAPYLYQWHSYISNEYKNLIVAIDYVNFFFLLLLTGYSLLLLLMREKVFSKNKEIFIMYGFMVFVWFCRVIITFINPMPLEPVAWVAYGQQIGSFIIFLLQLIPFAYLLHKKRVMRNNF